MPETKKFRTFGNIEIVLTEHQTKRRRQVDNVLKIDYQRSEYSLNEYIT